MAIRLSRILLIFVFSVALAGAQAGWAMGIIDLGQIVTFSATAGLVTENAKPVGGVEVERISTHGSDEQKETTRTDANGRFSFPEQTKRSMSKYMPVEPVVFQQIILRRDGQEFVAWETTKRNFDPNGELDGAAIDLRCELTDDVKYHERDRGVIKGICEL